MTTSLDSRVTRGDPSVGLCLRVVERSDHRTTLRKSRTPGADPRGFCRGRRRGLGPLYL